MIFCLNCYQSGVGRFKNWGGSMGGRDDFEMRGGKVDTPLRTMIYIYIYIYIYILYECCINKLKVCSVASRLYQGSSKHILYLIKFSLALLDY